MLSKEERNKICKKYGIKKLKQLPRIFVTDPVAVAIDAKVGDVIEIKRNSPVAGKTKYYRLIVGEK